MSDFKAKMHQIRFRLGLRPRPRWGSLQRSPRPPAGFKGPTSKGRGGEGRGEKGRGEGREGRERGRGGPISSAGPGPQKHVKTALWSAGPSLNTWHTEFDHSASWGAYTRNISKAIRYSMHCQGISQLNLHTLRFIHKWNEPHLPLPSQPQLVLIYRPRSDGRLSRPRCKVAPAEIRTCNVPITSRALYHTATSAPRVNI